MSETETRTVKGLKKRLDEQSETVKKMRGRISDLTDEIMDLKRDISNFKKYVINDIGSINDHLSKN